MPTIPHMLLLVLLRLLALPESGGPAGKSSLLAAGDGQFIRRDILCDNRTRPDDCPRANAHRGNERARRPDEGARPDLGLILAESVVIAGDRAGSDVRLFADICIADIA